MKVINFISVFAVPAMIFVIVGHGAYKGERVYESFMDGAKEGAVNLYKILPAIVGIVVAIGMFRASGAMDILVLLLKPVARLLQIPAEVIPLALLKPISGSGSLAIVRDTLTAYGADSFVGKVASTIMGCTETTFYTMAVYFGSIGIKDTRHTLKAALSADAAGVLASVWIWQILCNLQA